MALDEASRHELHEAVRRSFGDAAGDTLMELLPPVGWADVATRSDIDRLSVDIDRLSAATTSQIDRLSAATTGDIDRTAERQSERMDRLSERIDRLSADIERLAATTKRELEVQSLALRAAVTDAVRGAEHRILLWMFNTVLAGVAISVSVATAVALSV